MPRTKENNPPSPPISAPPLSQDLPGLLLHVRTYPTYHLTLAFFQVFFCLIKKKMGSDTTATTSDWTLATSKRRQDALYHHHNHHHDCGQPGVNRPGGPPTAKCSRSRSHAEPAKPRQFRPIKLRRRPNLRQRLYVASQTTSPAPIATSTYSVPDPPAETSDHPSHLVDVAMIDSGPGEEEGALKGFIGADAAPPFDRVQGNENTAEGGKFGGGFTWARADGSTT